MTAGRLARLVLLAALALACLPVATASAEEWHSEQPVSAGIGVPTPLGGVGDIEFWAPNRGVLITEGNGGNPAGVYAYDGTGWHLYSEVCGGHEGRIAWAGPDDFWTISDQQAGGEAGNGTPPSQVSLCHFENGAVVASYGEPVGQAVSYEPMDAASCLGPNDCWFAGERLPGTVNTGAFHLHWDGTSLTAVPSLTAREPSLGDAGRKVSGLANEGGRFYESVEVQEGDTPAPNEPPNQPYLLHRIVPTGSNPFSPITSPVDLGEGVSAKEVQGFRLSSSGDQLWAVAGARGQTSAGITAMRLTTGSFGQVVLQDPTEVFAPGDAVTGVAAEPGTGQAWVGYRSPSEGESEAPARMAQINADGAVETPVALPAGSEGIGRKGFAGPVSCPAAGQCWMATSKGWLFHLGGPLPQDTDPAMHVLIRTRPPDASLPSLPPDELPKDDSGAELPPAEETLPPIAAEPLPHRAKALAYDIHQRVVDKTLLELSFKLRAKAHVQLLAKRHKHVVAKTKRYVYGKGKHTLRLRLDPKRWPTGLDFQVHPLPHHASGHGHETSTARFLAALAVPTLPELGSAPAAGGTLTDAVETKDPPVAAAVAGAASSAASPDAEPVLGTPGPTFLGASPLEAAGEVWGVTSSVLYRDTEAGGWEAMQPTGPEGEPLAGVHFEESPGVGRTTPAGGVAALAKSQGKPMLITRSPGGPAQAAPDPGSALGPTEVLFGGAAPPTVPVAAFEAAAGGTGAYVVQTRELSTQIAPAAILRYAGGKWSREPICLGASAQPCRAPENAIFEVLAIDATSETNAWMLARAESSEEGLVLLRREATAGEGGTPAWVQVSLGPEGSLGSAFAAETKELGVTIAARRAGQPLTATSAGLWLDAELTVGGVASDATLYYDIGAGQIVASWCDLPEPADAKMCTLPLGEELTQGPGRSFAWPPDGGSSDPYGTRVVTGVGNGALLTLSGTAFLREPLLGGGAGSSSGAALWSPTEGWLGASSRPVRLTPAPLPSNLTSWPVPFRHPLAAIAPQPEASVAGLGSQAIAVGAEGEVAHYTPGLGWQAESLLNGAGVATTSPQLRAVAWPTPGFAYAVGDNGEMWLWRATTGLWESDPGKPPNLIRGNFNAIAFDPQEPDRGYAVGDQGLLLGYGHQWTQEKLPPGVDPEANFGHLAFAGGEALLTYTYPTSAGVVGGLLVDEGSGWRIDEEAGTALGGTAPTAVAGLPDGGAIVVGGGGAIIERESATAPWQRENFPAVGVVALAAFRENGQIRAMVLGGETIGVASSSGPEPIDCPPKTQTVACEELNEQPPPGQAPLLTAPSPVSPGFLLRQTATGWRDEEHQALPFSSGGAGGKFDLPRAPEPLTALLVNADGSEGWVVGGQNGGLGGKTNGPFLQTAQISRFPAESASSNFSTSPIPAPAANEAAFALGGGAGCVAACADLLHAGIGPDVWLPHAIDSAAGVPGLRGFLYAGPGVGAGLGSSLDAGAFAREEGAYAARLAPAPGGPPVYAAAAESDREGGEAPLASFVSQFAPGNTPNQAYYSFSSNGAGGGAVRVVVLDYSQPSLGTEQECWLAGQLDAAGAAGEPAIVLGDRSLQPIEDRPEFSASDGAEVIPIVVTGVAPQGCPQGSPATGASAYLFDYPGQNRAFTLTAGLRSIPAYGSGTLGYEGSIPALGETDFLGYSGYLLVSVNAAARNPATNVAPVGARLIPNVSEVALDALDGTQLRRSQPALFEALARRPRAGTACEGAASTTFCELGSPDPYVPIPAECKGETCGSGLLPEYSFSSSNPDIADFVKVDPSANNRRAVYLDSNNETVADSSSGLLCAFNAGTTTVTVSTGGLSYSAKVTVLPGSVARPCGTVPLRNPPTQESSVVVPTPPPVSPGPAFTKPATSLPPPAHPVLHVPVSHPVATAPSPTVPVHHPAPATPPPPPAANYFTTAPQIVPITPIVPPAPAAPIQPTPPSGTSPVTEPAVSPQPEKEEEAAFDLVHHAVAAPHARRAPAALAASPVDPGGGGRIFLYALPALILIAALAGGGIAREGRRRAIQPAYLRSRT